MKQAYFEGWYFKAQNEHEMIAIIPAYHRGSDGTESASIQIITKDQSYFVPYDASVYVSDPKKLSVWIGNNHFHSWYVQLMIRSEKVNACGKLFFSNNREHYQTYGHAFKKPCYPVMGPFACIKQLPCHHNVLSLCHRVDGAITLNGKDYIFDNGIGYVESDCGVSFPKSYVWTQCSIKSDNPSMIMAAVADIPFAGSNFIGSMAVIYHNHREYRLATYLGAKLQYLNPHKIILKQNRYRLVIQVIKTSRQSLYAPVGGVMSRRIHESAVSTVRYLFYHGKHLIFDITSDQAGFEYCLQRKKIK